MDYHEAARTIEAIAHRRNPLSPDQEKELKEIFAQINDSQAAGIIVILERDSEPLSPEVEVENKTAIEDELRKIKNKVKFVPIDARQQAASPTSDPG